MKYKHLLNFRFALHVLLIICYIIIVCFLLKLTIGSRPPASSTPKIEYSRIIPPKLPDPQKLEEIKKSLIPTKKESLISGAEETVNTESIALPGDNYDPLDNLSSTSLSTTNTLPGQITLPAGTSSNYSGDFSTRSESGRKNGLRHGGGNDTEATVTKALTYLKQKQNQDGSWGESGSENQAALTGLAMLAFLGHGETPDSKEYGTTIQKGLQRLVVFSSETGIEKSDRGFGHAILTYALAEAAGMVASGELTAAMDKRVEFLIKHQNKFGSFYYNYDNTPVTADKEVGSGMLKKGIIAGEPQCDLSFAGWNIQALKAAWSAGSEVPGLYEALRKSIDALNDVHQANGGGFSFGINGGKYGADPEVTPVGIYCLQTLGENGSKAVENGLKWLRKHKDGIQLLPAWNSNQRFPLYVWYYQTLMLYQQGNGSGNLWNAWNRSLKKMLLENQQQNGSWQLSRKHDDEEIKFKQEEDYSLYCTAFCAMTMEVYYRYGQSGPLKKERELQRDIFADINIPGLDLLLTRNRTAMLKNAVLKNRVVDVKIDFFKVGEFNGKPAAPAQEWEKNEFGAYQDKLNTIQVRNAREFPQLLMPSQRLVVLLDDLPKSLYGGLRLKSAIGSREFIPPQLASSKKNSPPAKSTPQEPPRYRAVQVLWNNKIIRQQALVVDNHYFDILIPNSLIEKNSNILEIRNAGTEPVCFDFLELSSDQDKPEIGLQSVTGAQEKSPEITVNQLATFKEPLAAAINSVDKTTSGNADPGKLLSSSGLFEYTDIFKRGSSQQLHYFHQIPRDIIEWMGGGGLKIALGEKTFLPGELLFDDSGSPKLSWYGLNRIMPLFDGHPRKLICNVVPVDQASIPYDLFWAAAQNSNDTVTIQIVSYRFRLAELEVTCPIPWAGATEVEITRGVTLPDALMKAETAGIPKQETGSKGIEIKRDAAIINKITNDTQECGIFQTTVNHSGFTTIRIRKRGASAVATVNRLQLPARVQVRFDNQSPKVINQDIESKYYRTGLRTTGNSFATESDCYRVSTILATRDKIDPAAQVIPWDRQSDLVAIQFNQNKNIIQHGARLFFGEAPAKAEYFAFWVYPRLGETWRTAVKLKFQLQSGSVRNFYEAMLTINRWQQVVIPLSGNISMSWGSICLIGDPDYPEYSSKTPISFELNGWAQYTRDEIPGLPDARVSVTKNHVAITLLGKPGTVTQFRRRLATPAIFKIPTISINQFNKELNAPESPTGNLSYNCIKSKTEIKFDQDTQIVQVNTRFPDKLDQEWLTQNLKFFNDVENKKIRTGELSPVLIIIKSKLGIGDVEMTEKPINK